MNFPESLKHWRIKKGLSQQALAEKAGVSQTAVYNWERGERKPKLEQVRCLAAALGVTIGDLNPEWYIFSQTELSNDLTRGLPLDELGLLQDYRVLNKTGKSEARKRTEELTRLPEYRENIEKHLQSNAAHDNGATEEQKAHADKIMDDDSEWK